jgi:hypothetical protein
VGILRRSHCAFAISPIHQPDDECKKPHYHVVFYSGNGPITLQAAKSKIPAEVPANDYVEITASSSGYQRYLIHLDDPEKEQFPEGINAITLINGFPLDLTRELSKSEKAKIRLELMRIIRENGVTEYCDFVFGLMDVGNPDMLDYACNHTILFNGVISSQWNRYTYGQGKVAGSTEQSATTGAK